MFPSMDASWKPHTNPKDPHLHPHPWMHRGNIILPPQDLPLVSPPMDASLWTTKLATAMPKSLSRWVGEQLGPPQHSATPSISTCVPIHGYIPGTPYPIHGCILGTPYNQPVQVLHLCPNSWIPRNGPPPWPCQRVCLNAPYIGLPWMGEPSKPPSTVLSHFSEQPLSHRSLGLGEQRWLQ